MAVPLHQSVGAVRSVASQPENHTAGVRPVGLIGHQVSVCFERQVFCSSQPAQTGVVTGDAKHFVCSRHAGFSGS